MAVRTVVVVGGGIAGLAAAVALDRSGRRVTVLERAPEFTDVGAGLSLWPNAMHALDALGLAGAVAARGAVEVGGGVRSRGGRWLTRTRNAELTLRFGRPLTVVHRADLVRTLADALPPSALRGGHEVVGIRPDGVVDSNGRFFAADLVVGADGVRSAVRGTPPRYTGCTTWRTITSPLEPDTPGAVLWGRGERIGFTAMPDRRFYVFAAATAARSGSSRAADLRRRFAGWPDPVPRLLAAVDDSEVLCHDVHDLPPLASYVRGNVVLLGDAAHGMDPILGQGACQALEDAVTLAVCLDATADLATALARYDRERRPRTQAIARRAARLGAVARWRSLPATALRDLAAWAVPASATLRSMSPILSWQPPRA
ncbi:2-polyprenyl-6-methoxyphenol hydroxylase-like FAD-dependent oxidoreductase [Saccharothrix tamanrassetensis]|uniref:2-polyprenyl-6-methoxyphenol hydroxylase-like FAD-dependent oxidoreductase n=1 Tax=Saccharothrix tamanrassetensis TaxID=1051531 RepID=A0A841C967_9PSEU|nr:FAD-dependent oxidoreductase [Saccharothrix tamanrassetensis]MBB5953959.1 2-polyprenyl-6-methoxyphenol hydroxylase-like FAD-dependent oxidoreductase [Saccharothrix tamanrassetensis]